MVSWIHPRKCGPIGVDLGSRSIKLLQLTPDRTSVLEAGRWDLPHVEDEKPESHDERLADALRQARNARSFRGREVVLCLGAGELFVQNIRVPKLAGEELERVVRYEAGGRLPFPAEEAELRYLEAGDVRQGETSKREVILLACHRPQLERTLGILDAAGLHAVGVDAEPAALLRCYGRQFRRDDDRNQRTLFVHAGATNTSVVIAEDNEPLFIKYLGIGGDDFDRAVAQRLKMDLSSAVALRRHHADRAESQQDHEVAKSIGEALRPVIDRLAGEIALCIRYHSVTFRGQQLARFILGGGEATEHLAAVLSSRLDIPCELGDPLRPYPKASVVGRRSQWDIATGLALRETN